MPFPARGVLAGPPSESLSNGRHPLRKKAENGVFPAISKALLALALHLCSFFQTHARVLLPKRK